MNYDKEIWRVLTEAGMNGLSVQKIARHVFNASNNFFETVTFEEVHAYVQQYLLKNSKNPDSIIESTGVRGMKIDEGDDEVVGMIVAGNTENETIMVVSENGYGKRSQVEDYRKTNRGAKGVKTLNITEKTGRLVSIKNVTDENDLMIINKSGITIRLAVSDCRVMGRATQGVRLINLSKKNDVIASVCKVMSSELEAMVEEESRAQWTQKKEDIQRDTTATPATEESNTENNDSEISEKE